MPVQELERAYSSTPQSNIAGLRRYDVSIVIAQPSNRILAPVEVQKPGFKPIEQAPNLVTSNIPKWDSLMEMSRFIKDINTGLAEGKSLIEAVSKSAHELEINVRAYGSEIIKSKAVLLHLNRFESVDGVTRIVGNNGRPIIDSISAKERKGAVLGGSKQTEDSLISAENNSFAVLMSPDGWHGFTDQYGRETKPHSNAQVLVFWKDKRGQLKGLTFHVDLQLEQTRKTMISLGVSEELLVGETEKVLIMNIVKNPAFLSLPEAYDNPFEYVLDKILAARGNSTFKLLQEDGTEEIRPIDEVRSDIARFEELLQGNQEEESHIAELVNYILAEASNIQDSGVQQQIVSKMEKTILRLTRAYLKDSGKIPIIHPGISFEPSKNTYNEPLSLSREDDNFAGEIAYLKTRAGCPPSMGSTMTLSGVSLGSSTGGSIGGSSLVESDADGSLEFECHKCHRVNDRPRGGRRPLCKWCGVKFGGC